MTPFADYLAEINKNLAHGDATEHTHRPALKKLLESVRRGIVATNEPTRILCGAPDFNITKGRVPLGHVETKDISEDLTRMEKGKPPYGEQFGRYRAGLPNWILTDYLDFRWYVTGELRMTVRLAELDANRNLKPIANGEAELGNLLEAFMTQKSKTIGTAKALAERMAGMTRIIRGLISKTFEHEVAKGFLHKWLAAFRETLIPDLDENRFADMFAQTLAYGLFAARVHTPPTKDFAREMAAFNLPKTNPFLRKLFSEIAGVDMPETIDWAVDDLVELLNRADLAAVLKDFGKGRGREDPVVHFYETFLAAYDPKMREVRGVYYTPEPVVSYIVRSVDNLLKSRFKRAKGLADENTLILDPATGTATFLYFVVNQIYQRFAKQHGAWDGYVSEHLLNRVFGFELLIAPYAIAHLKLGMLLADLGYKFGSDQRLGVFLTNTLEEAAKKSEQLFASWISEEANAAAEIKRDRPIMVVLGNPPYSKASYNRSDWIEQLMEPYKVTVRKEESQIQALSNDYIKFIRFSQWRIDQTGSGVVGLITGHGYINGPQARDMRSSLLKSFDEIYVLNLHGSVRREAKQAQEQEDAPVFQIQQGTAIILAVKGTGTKIIRYCDCFGSLKSKFAYLNSHDLTTTSWIDVKPVAPNFFFVPSAEASVDIALEYDAYPSLTDIFGTGNRSQDKEKRWATGMATQQDEFAVSFDDGEVKRKISELVTSNSEDELRSKYALCTTDQWSYQRAKKELAAGTWKANLFDYAYRPFNTMRSVFDREFKSYGSGKIDRDGYATDIDCNNGFKIVISKVPNDRGLKGFLTKVWEVYGGFSAVQLSNMTHEPCAPWALTWGVTGVPKNTDIDDNVIKNYFVHLRDGGR